MWVLDVAALSTTEILPEAELGSTLISWTPDGALLVGYHRGLADGSYFYSVRPDGSDRQMLTLEAGAQVLGWMSLPEMRVMTRLTIDPWPARIRAAAESATADGSADALAEVVAQ